MSDLDPYRSEDGQPQFHETLCVYFDLLGFSDMSYEATREGQKSELLKKFYTVFSRTIEGLDNLLFGIQARVFTDNILLTAPNLTGHAENELGRLLSKVGFMQLLFADEGFFLRGAITIGDLFIDERVVMGPALVEAVKLESEVAKNPRIILSPGMTQKVKEHLGFYAEVKLAPHNVELAVDSDNQVFINYLNEIFMDEDHIYWDVIEHHKAYIENAKRKYSSDQRILRKYEWLGTYHNWFCDKVGRRFGLSNDYWIENDLPSEGPILLSEAIERGF